MKLKILNPNDTYFQEGQTFELESDQHGHFITDKSEPDEPCFHSLDDLIFDNILFEIMK